MTIEKLCSIPYIMHRLQSLTLELYKVEQLNPYKGNVITDMPRGGEGKDIAAWYTEEKERIEGEIASVKRELQEAREERNSFIEGVEDLEMRDIIRFRCVNNMSWRDIEYTMGINRETARNRFFDFFKES